MADNKGSITFEGLVDKVLREDGGDFLREVLSMLAHKIMDLEVRRQTGAERHERTAERTNQRNGTRDRPWQTRVGTIDLEVPRLRRGGYVPCFLEPRRRAEKALTAVVQEAYVGGVSTRRVDGLVESLGGSGISKSEVSRLCQELDVGVAEFRARPLTGRFPYLWLDARYEKVRVLHRIVSNAVVVAYAVRETGEREVIGIDVGPSEDEGFWKQFLRGLVERGLAGVQLVISDAHGGLKKAIREVLTGASWQRCRVHFMRNVLSVVPRAAQGAVSALVRSIFFQPDQRAAREQTTKVLAALRKQAPRAALLLEDATEDVIAYMAFPSQHWRQIHSTNPLERLNREIARRTDVVGIFPNQAAVLRLVGTMLIEQNEEWSIGRRYFSQQSMALICAPAGEDATRAIAAAAEVSV
ncbi:MAG: IS256 family transposase [Polyangiaceae bacterium]